MASGCQQDSNPSFGPNFGPNFGLNLNTSLREFLQCPVCFEFCKPRIFMCVNGHILCHVCQKSVAQCPTCRVEGQPSLRCIALEMISYKVKRPCPNKREGCGEMLNHSEMDGHFPVCDYSVECRVAIGQAGRGRKGFCDWRGNRRELVLHVKREHPRQYSENETVYFEHKINGNWRAQRMECSTLVAALGELFWVDFRYGVFNKGTANLGAIYVGNRENASKYCCEYKFSSPDGLLQNTTCSQAIVMCEDSFHIFSLKLPDSFMNQFLSADRTFSYSIKIGKK